MKAQHQARMQHLADNNPYARGNMTEAIEVEAANPELAKRLMKEAGIGSGGAVTFTGEQLLQQQAAARVREARVEALNHNQQRLRRGAVS